MTLCVGKPELIPRLRRSQLRATSWKELTAIPPIPCCRTLRKEVGIICQRQEFAWNGDSAKFARFGLVSITMRRCNCTIIIQVCDLLSAFEMTACNDVPAGRQYLTAGVLTNMHTMLYGSNTSTYFSCRPVFSLEEYLPLCYLHIICKFF